MCSRYEIDVEWEAIVEAFGLDGPPTDYKTGEIRPTDKALIISDDGPQGLGWGLPSPWDGKPLINARAETLEQKKTFNPLVNRRCLVPASAYFEWRKDGKLRLRNRIFLQNTALFAFAGLYTDEHFTIITCEPSPTLAHIHNRMPVILPPPAFQAWCDPSHSYDTVQHLLKAFPDEELAANENASQASPQGDLFG